jgi:ribosome-binding protein aMBF1 (putative translation factor)
MKKQAVKLKSFESLKRELLKDQSTKKAYKDLQPEFAFIRQIIDKRIEKHISQKELAKRLGTGQSAISRLESGTYNPSFQFLKKLSKALESELVITFK